jgi:hypothetical protein
LLDRAVTDLTQSDIAGAQAIYGQARSQLKSICEETVDATFWN